MAKTRIAYCPHCDEDREVRITVQWQSDFCITCAENIDSSPAPNPSTDS